MMFSVSDGTRPSTIYNPHAFPSRMTTAQLLEGLMSFYYTLEGITPLDYSPKNDKQTLPPRILSFNNSKNLRMPFEPLDMRSIENELIERGYNPYGEQLMKNGMTGKTMKVRVFCTPLHMQRLKHIAAPKEKSGSGVADRNRLHRQPTTNSESLRFGTMEVDCLKTHSSASFARNRLFEASDAYAAFVCRRCGIFAEKIVNVEKREFECRICFKEKKKQKISLVEIPYASKLAMVEQMAAGILPKIIVEKNS